MCGSAATTAAHQYQNICSHRSSSTSVGALPQKFADRNRSFASAKHPTECEVGEVQRARRHDLAPRYGRMGKREKGQVLDQACEVTGDTRKYALAPLKDPPGEPPVKRTRRRSPSFGPSGGS